MSTTHEPTGVVRINSWPMVIGLGIGAGLGFLSSALLPSSVSWGIECAKAALAVLVVVSVCIVPFTDIDRATDHFDRLDRLRECVATAKEKAENKFTSWGLGAGTACGIFLAGLVWTLGNDPQAASNSALASGSVTGAGLAFAIAAAGKGKPSRSSEGAQSP